MSHPSSRRAVAAPLPSFPGRRVLCVSDIHGNLPLLKGLLDKAAFAPEDVLIVLGDILERNEGSLETLRYVIELSKNYTLYSVLGNCDNLVLDFVDEYGDLPDAFFARWLGNLGPRSALNQMAAEAGVSLARPEDYPAARRKLKTAFREELDFLRAMPHILVNDDYLLVHGGVPREERLEELTAFDVMKNDDFLSQGHAFRRWVVVGHWPVTLYRGDIPQADPIVERERHIVSIDGGCTLKWDGQLNALFLPEKPDGNFSWVSWDGFPTVTALEAQAPSSDPVNIRWSDHQITILEEGAEFCRCRHHATGREMDILTEYICRQGDGTAVCEDSTDYRLPVSPGDTLSVVRRTSRGILCKKNGVTGWYFGPTGDGR